MSVFSRGDVEYEGTCVVRVQWHYSTANIMDVGMSEQFRRCMLLDIVLLRNVWKVVGNQHLQPQC